MFYNEDGTFIGNSNILSFGQAGKDLQVIMEKLITNDNVMKLLYYGQKDALKQPNLDATTKLSMVNDYIRVVPVLPKDVEAKNYIIIQLDNFSPSGSDAMVYRDFLVSFDIFCNAETWILDDYLLRPYAIMNEIDRMFNVSKLNSSGPINFVGANSILINENLLGFTIAYRVYDYR